MTQHDDSRITDWLTRGEGLGRGAALDAALAEARSTKQRPAWFVSLAGGTIAEPRGTILLRRSAVLLAAVVLVGGLLVGGLAAGGILPLRPPQQPVPSAAAIVPVLTAAPSNGPAKSSTGLVAYTVVDCAYDGCDHPPCSMLGATRCVTRPWLAASDGSNAHVLPGTRVVGWSAEGSRLVIQDTKPVGGAVSLLVDDSTGALVATVELPCTGPSTDGKNYGVGGHLCGGQDEFALSSDGTRAVFVQTDPNVDNSSVLGIIDLATGQTTLLAATRTTNPPDGVCNTSTKARTCQGFDGSPRWSPDGRSIAFERQGIAPEPGGASWDSAALFVVDADGSNLRRVTPSSLQAIGPAWSPDGTHLAFDGSHMIVSADGTSVLDIKDDVYTIGVDGSGLARLTDDGISGLPDWTSGGRLAFVRNAAPTNSEHWIMDADGSNQARLGGTLADLTAAGCTTCVYVAHEPVHGALPRAYWQPLP